MGGMDVRLGGFMVFMAGRLAWLVGMVDRLCTTFLSCACDSRDLLFMLGDLLCTSNRRVFDSADRVIQVCGESIVTRPDARNGLTSLFHRRES
jgi:hypothetical protein